MKTINTADATGAALDWLVAKCEGHTQETTVFPNGVRSLRVFIADGGVAFDALTGAYLDFTADWSQMGPIIEREEIRIDPPRSVALWSAEKNGHLCHGTAPLIAAARCYVTSKLGETAEVPEELT